MIDENTIQQAEKLVAQGDNADPAEVQRTLAKVIKDDPEAFKAAMRRKS